MFTLPDSSEQARTIFSENYQEYIRLLGSRDISDLLFKKDLMGMSRFTKVLQMNEFRFILFAAMWKYGQADITQVAGYDAATFIRVCAFGDPLTLPCIQ